MIAILYMPLYKVYPYYPSPPFKKETCCGTKSILCILSMELGFHLRCDAP